MRENALRRYHTDLEAALAEGEAKGRTEGEAHARCSLLKNLLAYPDTARLRPEVLAQMTGLTIEAVKIELEKRREK